MTRTRISALTKLLAVFLFVPVICLPTGADRYSAPENPAKSSLALPEPPCIPGYVKDKLNIDPDRIHSLVKGYMKEKALESTTEDFLFSYLPSELFREVLQGDFENADLPATFGLLYYSGFNGGIWLNTIMRSSDGDGIGPTRMIRMIKPMVMKYISRQCGKRLALLEESGQEKKLKVLRKSFNSIIQSYGYNRGYLMKIIERSPQGSFIPADYVSCEGLLDCEYFLGVSPALSPLIPVREKLEDPPDDNWRGLSILLREKSPAAIKRGESVWRNIMSDNELDPGSHKALVDISAEYLMLNEAVLLICAKALAEGKARDIDHALAADTALRVWLEAYMIGLGENEKN